MSWCDLPEFDGTELFEGFWMKFSIFAERFNWSSSDMAFYLVTSLRGKALEYVSYLPHRDLYNVSVLYSALKSRFGDIETAQICRMKLRNITMLTSESVQEYVCRTEINVRKSFPGVNEDLLVKLITEYAIYGYPDGNIGYRVLTKEPSTVSELIKEILWQEHCRQSLKSVEKSRCTEDSNFEKHFEIGNKRNMNFTEHDIRRNKVSENTAVNMQNDISLYNSKQKLGKENYTVEKDLEQVQRRAARFVYNEYQDVSPGCVSSLMERLKWEPLKDLKDRRCKDRLTMAYKIRNRLVDIDPSNYYKPGDSRTRGGHRIHQQRTLKDQYRYSFFPRSTREWNTLPEKATTAATLEEFKASLTILPEALTGASHT
ncbi:unnamed protein product [Mytilus edulis]|uniref:Paraneoplastic antigen Ma-like C-terminal domain-containing protein n=1 Tax=Mytilus edulis TaxID=6550 RepID=A0A8S3V530_MYTED|nr:unnamed protein product [Mytilus edulis]